MVRYLLLLTGLVLFSCSENKTHTVTQLPVVPAVTSIDSSNLLLDQFVEINPDNLHIYSPCDTINGQKFKGSEISRCFYHFLKFDNNIAFFNQILYDSIYGCYKFKFAKNKTGLILRTPSQYDVTAIDLYVWDDSAKKVINVINLADAFGDGDWYFVQDAWLADINKDNNIDIITRKRDYTGSDDTTKVTTTDSLFVMLGDGSNFKKSLVKVDTIQYKILNWTQ